ncbi:MAG: hypothetical protein KF901_06915 [Myxococcales bacterium]|nr:hypothetical protein [Myxococcales bacterium]
MMRGTTTGWKQWTDEKARALLALMVVLAGCERGMPDPATNRPHLDDAGTPGWENPMERSNPSSGGDAGCVEWGGEFAQTCPDAGPPPECELGEKERCYDGADAPPRGCSWGERTCEEDGTWGECWGSVIPAEGETECRTVPDCTAGATRHCYVGMTDTPPEGCSWGAQTCDADGTWGECLGSTAPMDGRDSCLPDRECEPRTARQCYVGATATPPAGCSWGSQVCEPDGSWGDCTGYLAPPAGRVDCGPTECSPGTARQCHPDGAPPAGCGWGTQTCGPDWTWGTCTGATSPSAGRTTCLACDPGASRSCHPSGTAPAGCRDGAQVCQADGSWGTCSGATVPAAGRTTCLACDPGASQQCHPSGTPPSGCGWGARSCRADGSWGSCSGGTRPAAGVDSCDCPVGVGQHIVYDAYRAAYPASTMPRNPTELNGYRPSLAAYPMTARSLNAGNEIVDRSRGGLTNANILAGLNVSRQAAIDDAVARGLLAVGGVALSEQTSPVGRLVTTANHPEATAGTCNGVGWAWGSILYDAVDGTRRELVYHYVGVCTNVGDGEVFTHLSAPAAVCAPPVGF